MQKVLVSCAILICLMAGTATGRCLFGSTVSTEVQYQQHPDAPIHAISFRTSQTVTGAIEFPSLNALQVEQNEFNLYVVDVAIDFGDTLIDIHFLNTEPSTFAPGHFNGYAFIFDAQQPVDISAASINNNGFINKQISIPSIQKKQFGFSSSRSVYTGEGATRVKNEVYQEQRGYFFCTQNRPYRFS